ncbi:TIGR02678 family protein [Thalassobacillus devorans]|uniref:TIGR02678 family protein n=1 Tax=Thalassobacillus devorans TaxID=279813 RepID=UPI00048FFBC3|nr:TIGR02678 family protein [Thalassobacillus devorans]
MTEPKGFDEKAEEALSILFEQFWVLRSEEPELYQKIREREHQLKRYISDKFGFDLIVHQHFIKLEKIPVEAKPWMGIQEFSDPRDYAIFCCGLAFTENRSVDEQFLLSEICEDIRDMYPGAFSLDWTNYNHRKSLVRALKKLLDMHIIKLVDGDIEMFAADENYEALYEVTVYARYFIRSYPDDLFRYDTKEAILASEWQRQGTDERRKRVYRKLLFSPVVYRTSEDDPDFAYLRNFRNRLADDIESHTPFRLEMFKNAAMLVMEENRQRFHLFPDQKMTSMLILHFAALVREKVAHETINAFGQVKWTETEFDRMVQLLIDDYSHGWSKAYRNSGTMAIRNELFEALQAWELAYKEKESGMFVLKPAIARLIGRYPKEYLEKRREKDGQDE